LLKEAHVEARGLEPTMRAIVLLQLSDAYEDENPITAAAMAHEAFLAALEIEDEPDSCGSEAGDESDCNRKSRIVSGALRRLTRRSADLVETLLPEVDERSRTAASFWLFKHYVEQKDFERAEAMLANLQGEDFPYSIVSQLMRALPPQRAGDLIPIFLQAEESYSQTCDRDLSGPDLPSLLRDHWTRLPQPLVLDAIDMALQCANRMDERSKGVHTEFRSIAGKVSFASASELRLYEILPVLKELDPDRAESLLRKEPMLASRLASLPASPNKLWEEPNRELLAPGEYSVSMRMWTGDSTGDGDASDEDYLALERIERDIRKNTLRDPRGAIAAANALPLRVKNEWDGSPRINTLVVISRQLVQAKNPAAEDALDALQKAIAQLAPSRQPRLLAECGELYWEFHDAEGLKRMVALGLKIANALYEGDSVDAERQKQWKIEWPSVRAYGLVVNLAAKLSPQYANAILGEIDQREIHVLLKVSFAEGLLGRNLTHLSVD
jgi:hypothetical protein